MSRLQQVGDVWGTYPEDVRINSVSIFGNLLSQLCLQPEEELPNSFDLRSVIGHDVLTNPKALNKLIECLFVFLLLHVDPPQHLMDLSDLTSSRLVKPVL